MKTITVIGATGNMGSGISKNLAKGNYHLLLAGNSSEKINELVNAILSTGPTAKIEAVDLSVKVPESDIYILALPYHKELEMAKVIKETAKGKIVVSISNPLNENFSGLVTAADTSAGEEIQKLLPDSKVVKAFNTNYSSNFATPVIDGKTVDSYLAGNDDKALEVVTELVSTAGFTPIVAGNLSVSRTLEQMQFLLIQLTMKYGYNWLAGWKILHN
jgi:8-hydroxy-5-deazaflavin:NADPH oxidoreductase